MTYEGTDMPDNDTAGPPSNRWGTGRIDAASVVIGLLFVAFAILALADRFWAEIDPVLVVGGAIIAIGVAMIAGVIVRGRRGGQNGA